MLLKLENICYSYPQKDTALLHNVSLELCEGEVLGLLGGNGSGKSTLLNIACGLITPASGSVTLCGLPCKTEKDFAQARKHLGYLLQNSDDMLFCPSILEDVAFAPYHNGKTAKEAEQTAWETLESLGIKHHATANGNNLSGGEKKMAALACILAMQPKLLFLDEPTNDLDDNARQNILSILKERRISSLIVSHDQDFMQQLCTRFCVLESGSLHAHH